MKWGGHCESYTFLSQRNFRLAKCNIVTGATRAGRCWWCSTLLWRQTVDKSNVPRKFARAIKLVFRPIFGPTLTRKSAIPTCDCIWMKILANVFLFSQKMPPHFSADKPPRVAMLWSSVHLCSPAESVHWQNHTKCNYMLPMMSVHWLYCDKQESKNSNRIESIGWIIFKNGICIRIDQSNIRLAHLGRVQFVWFCAISSEHRQTVHRFDLQLLVKQLPVHRNYHNSRSRHLLWIRYRHTHCKRYSYSVHFFPSVAFPNEFSSQRNLISEKFNYHGSAIPLYFWNCKQYALNKQQTHVFFLCHCFNTMDYDTLSQTSVVMYYDPNESNEQEGRQLNSHTHTRILLLLHLMLQSFECVCVCVCANNIM